MVRGRTVVATLLLALTLAACGSSSGGDSAVTDPASGSDGTTASTVESAAGTDAGAGSGSSAIPQSDAIDAIAKDIPSDPNGPELAATCTALRAGLDGLAIGAVDEGTIQTELDALVAVVTGIDEKVGDALGKDAKAAGSWCHDKGFAN